RLERQAQRLKAADFCNVLTGTELLEKTDALLPEQRERHYRPTVALAMFLKQALSDRSCQRAISGWIAQCVLEGLKPPSARTGGYLPGAPTSPPAPDGASERRLSTPESRGSSSPPTTALVHELATHFLGLKGNPETGRPTARGNLSSARIWTGR
ncbi:IS4 family transposase, partial [mine drainage metagenome]